MVIKFKAFPKGSLSGIGLYQFRHYGKEVPPPHLCFTAQERNSTIQMVVTGNPSKGQTFETSVNGRIWEEFIPGTTTITLANVGDKVYFRGNNTTVSESSSNYYSYNMTGKIAASGNIMSLLDKTCSAENVPTYCYYYMFSSCTSLTTAPNLPATTLAKNCYSSMFYNCTSLTTAPNLPATTLADYCYYYMFANCTSLTTAPNLPATTLANYCYSSMFQGCTSLTTVPNLPATTLAYNCYSSMFSSCTSLTTAPNLPATTLANYCYSSMFQGCTSLTTVPNLPATTLANYCYSSMFNGCTSLYVSDTSGAGYNKAWKIPTTGKTSGSFTMLSMFSNCLGKRSTDSPSFNRAQKTYYTQNVPV